MASQTSFIVTSTTPPVVKKLPIVSISSAPLDIDAAPEPGKRWRPRLHLVAPRGWLNDPCAPGYDPINKLYHLGFQWNPNSTEWGNISWGAAISHDLLTWQVSSNPSMQPSAQCDPGGVFTGCLVPTAIDGAENGTLTALYTSVSRLPIHYTRPYFRTSEAVALSTSNDSGRTWKRHTGNPVLAEPPSGIDVTGWRDPFVASWPSLEKLVKQQSLNPDKKSLYAVVAGGIRGKTPTVFLYQVHAHALDTWEYLGPLITPGLNFCPSPRWTGDFGMNWEVSNFVTLASTDGKQFRDFLICGVEGRLATAETIRTKGNFRATNAQMWLCGTLTAAAGVQMKFRFGGRLDHGLYYAGNSFWDPQTQQQVIYGWILEDDLDAQVRQRQGWAGVISLPRVLKMQVLTSVIGALSSPLQSIGCIELIPENKHCSSFTTVTLCAVPDPRLSKLRGSKFPSRDSPTRSWSGGFVFPVAWSQWEMKAEFQVEEDVAKVGFDIIHSSTEFTRVYFNAKSETIVVDRSCSTSLHGIRTCPEEAPHTLFVFEQRRMDGHFAGRPMVEALAFHVVFGNSSHSAFTNQIKAAIDLRSGAMSTPQSPSATPLVDVPIFPSPHGDNVLNSLADATEYELPPRRQADELVHTYWSVMHPLFPVPDRSRFMQSYNALFFGKTADIDERILLSTLNAMFAFAVQLHESTDRNGRERLSGKYFRRAQALLQLTVWEKGSIDLVQCLLLISQYLQCTNQPHQTWMTVGSAVRIAQSLGLHLTEVWSTPGDEGAALKRRVWQSCVIMDRYDEKHPICHTKLILDLEQYALLMGDPQ
ncbi:glycoside hydrolase family 32 protein [Curvularia clavata]|uniref:Glycoside hydrolase family 32 protein n=1 Tax=Curvularia clavata TaxID=95742 RepID=A0A9Q9DSP6_CURCL|nr:glycoside hydrolase family 32 protein [Curvularia clavata]